ncbi:thiol peroxidase [Ichthyobacterium seriolicida]|uniref:Thiol peroxidase n=1 Tax=Ichthyobacterium seriolicida TaxID=242600 RepID=A0A1J1E8C0_9FLAO|nr:thiol peroxidase [Ichthyobacterium seriolicida]BAV94179.1 thiol peroxidase, Tpx-type [Ichthyobacterium seriolicida]
MQNITLKGKPVTVSGTLPKVGSPAPNFTLVANDLSEVQLNTFDGNDIILNVFPSIDTATCALSVKQFNQKAASLSENIKVLCISRDLPFAQSRFCGAQDIKNVISLSDFRTGNFGNSYGLNISSGPLSGLLARAVVLIDKNGTIKYTELVSEVSNEPNYEEVFKYL